MGRKLASYGLFAAGLLWALAVPAGAVPVKAAVVRSTGTMFLGQTIWRELNAGWAEFGDTPVEINYTSLAGGNWTLQQIEATDADVLILSNPAFLTYTAAEIATVQQYVEAGHGLIISYGKFRSADRALAPLVGLDESIQLGTATFGDSFDFQALVLDHPVLVGVPAPYQSGTLFGALPASDGVSWQFDDGGVVITESWAVTGTITAREVIVGRETPEYRGLYFGHYIEDKADGANQQDMQVFYNSLLWTAGLPEPAMGLLLLIGTSLVVLKRRW